MPRHAIDSSTYLRTHVLHDPQQGAYIWSPTLRSVNETYFEAVVEYFESQEYRPKITHEEKGVMKLETIISAQGKDGEMIRCGHIYALARFLDLTGLGRLAFQKMKIIEPTTPLPVLTVAGGIFTHAEPEIREWLTEYLAREYWSLVKSDTTELSALMEENKDLAKHVFKKLAGDLISQSSSDDRPAADTRTVNQRNGVGPDTNDTDIKHEVIDLWDGDTGRIEGEAGCPGQQDQSPRTKKARSMPSDDSEEEIVTRKRRRTHRVNKEDELSKQLTEIERLRVLFEEAYLPDICRVLQTKDPRTHVFR